MAANIFLFFYSVQGVGGVEAGGGGIGGAPYKKNGETKKNSVQGVGGAVAGGGEGGIWGGPI